MARITRRGDPAPVDLYVGTFDPRFTLSTFGIVPANNDAVLATVQVSRRRVVSALTIRVNVQAGNIDVGIYDDDGNRLGSSGSVACPAAGTHAIALTAPVTLDPGRVYWFALAASLNTATFARGSSSSIAPDAPVTHGVVAASLPLPDPIVLPTDGGNATPLGVWAV